MIKSLLRLFFLFLLLAPLAGYCQLPTPKWVSTMGGAGDSKPTGMVTDNQNNVYVAGYFNGTVDFDHSAGVKNLTSVGGYDIYVAKYDANGAILWAISMGGDDLDQVNAMGIDANGNPTIIGQFRSSQLNIGTTSLTAAGDEDVFIIHLNTNGSLLWAKSIGGPQTDRGEQVTADAQGNVIATAIFQQTISIGGHTETAISGYNGLIVKYDAAGNYLWNISLGSTTGDTQVYGNGIDSQGNIVVSGTFSGAVDFDPLGLHQIVNSGFNTPFVAKYTPAGKLVWVKTITGNVINNGSALSIDTNDDIYLTASFNNSLNFGAGTTISAVGNQDTFLAKYLANGTFVFAKDIGGSSGTSFNYMIRNDKNKSVYITGYFSGTIDFDPSAAVANVSYHGQRDLYLAKYDLNGNYQWAFSAGSPNCNLTLGIEIAVINVDDIVLGGSFCSTVNFDPSTCSVTSRTAQNFTSDSFMARYIQNSTASGQITAFSIPQQLAPAVIDNTNLTVTVVMPAGTNVTALVPNISVSTGTLAPASGTAQNFTNPVTYTISGGCVATVYKTTVVLAKPAATCAGTTNIITGDTPAPSGTYAWQVLQGNTWVNAPGTNNTANYQTSALANSTAANIVYTLRRQTTAAGGAISYDSYYQLTVEPLIAISNNTATTPAVSTFCTTGDPAIITGSTPTGGTGVFNYQWQSSADNVTFTNVANATAKDYDPPVVTATTYYRRTVSSGTCNTPTNSNAIKVTVLPAIANNSATATGTTIFCASGNATVITGSTPTGGDGTYLYQWQSSTDNVTFNAIPAATTKDYDPAESAVTMYYRRLVTSAACSLLSNTVNITVVPAPANVVLTPVAAICAGSRATIAVSSPIAGLTYQWYNSPAKTTVLFTGTSYTTDALRINQTYYVEASNGTCVSPALTSITVNVNQAPAAPAVVSNSVAVCSGTPANLEVASPQATLTYKWYNIANGGNAVSTGAQYITGALSGNANYYVEATNASGCVSARTPVNININANPQIAAQGATVCTGSTATLTATSTDNNVTIKWYANALGGNSLGTGASFTTPTVNAAITYYAEATNNTTGCISASRAAANIQLAQPLPAPVLTAGAITSTSVAYQWNVVPNATAYEISFDNGTTFIPQAAGNAGIPNGMQGLKPGQTVTITVRAIGALPCQVSSNSNTLTLTAASPDNNIYVANAFTPNNDGKNDVVYVHSENINTLKFYVYNQWGEMLFSSTSMQNGWDGTYKGKLEPAGVYVYYIQAVMKDGTALNKKGTITLIR